MTAQIQEAELGAFVEQHKRKAVEKYGKELQAGINKLVSGVDEPPAAPAEVTAYVKAKKDEWLLPDSDLLKV